MKKLILILILIGMIGCVSGTLTDDSLTLSAWQFQERVSSTIATQITKQEFTIKDTTINLYYVDYQKGMLKLKFTANKGGKELKIINPVYIYNPPYWVNSSGSRREDILNATKYMLYQIASNSEFGKSTDDGKDPTLIIYPTQDGVLIENLGSDVDFSTLVSGAGTSTSLTGTTAAVYLSTVSTSNKFRVLRRGAFTFNTSPLNTTDTISSAKFRTYYSGESTGLGSFWFNIYGFTPADPSALATGDYDSVNNVKYCDTYIHTDNISAGSNVNFTFNTAGLNNISTTGFTNISMRFKWDEENSFGGTWASSQTSSYTFYCVEESTTDYRPYLEIIYTECVPPTAAFSANTTTGNYPLNVGFTDSSTGSATLTYAWDIDGDGDTDYTSQNPTHTYTSAGLYTVNLTVTNGCGSDLESKIDYINVTSPPVTTTPTTTPPTTTPTTTPTTIPTTPYQECIDVTKTTGVDWLMYAWNDTNTSVNLIIFNNEVVDVVNPFIITNLTLGESYKVTIANDTCSYTDYGKPGVGTIIPFIPDLWFWFIVICASLVIGLYGFRIFFLFVVLLFILTIPLAMMQETTIILFWGVFFVCCMIISLIGVKYRD